jgi:hypothetical protein
MTHSGVCTRIAVTVLLSILIAHDLLSLPSSPRGEIVVRSIHHRHDVGLLRIQVVADILAAVDRQVLARDHGLYILDWNVKVGGINSHDAAPFDLQNSSLSCWVRIEAAVAERRDGEHIGHRADFLAVGIKDMRALDVAQIGDNVEPPMSCVVSITRQG